MYYTHDMASPDENRETRESRAEKAKKLKREIEFLEIEMGICEVKEDEKKAETWKRSSADLKEKLLKSYSEGVDYSEIMKKVKEEIDEELRIGKEEEERKIKLELITSIENEKKLLEKIAELERNQRDLINKLRVKVSGERRNQNDRSCYICGRYGHYAKECKDNFKNKNSGIYLSRLEDFKEIKKRKKRLDERVERINLEPLTFKSLLINFPEVLGELGGKIEFCKIEKCSITTSPGKRVVKKGQIIPQALKVKTWEYLKDLEKRGIIRKSHSAWRNPIRALEKPDGSIRIVSNLMCLNDMVEKDPYELRNIREIVSSTQGSEWFSVVDLKEAFYHIEIEKKDKEKTAFEVDGRVFEWNSMVMGFKNSPQIMQRLMNRIFDDLRGNGVEIYMDDIIIHTKSINRHERLVKEVFRRLKENNLRVNKKKLQLCLKEVKLLGVSINGKEQLPSEIKKLEALEYERPKNVSELRRFLGLTGWFRQFIPNYAALTVSLTDALKIKNKKWWNWSEEMEEEFIKLKTTLKNCGKLLLPNYDKEFLLRTDASNNGMGAVLLQKDNSGEWRPIQWASKKFTPAEVKYE